MSSDNQYTALGPTEIGFQTNGSNIRMGASIAGREAGVVAHADTGFGLEGTGAAGGVHGKGIAPPAPLDTFDVHPTGVGVFGESVHDNGVRGSSTAGDGVAGFTVSSGKSGVFGLNSAQPLANGGSPEFPAGPPQTGFGVFGRCDLVAGAGVGGRCEGGDPAAGTGGAGVIGTSQAGDGVVGGSDANNKSGVFGYNNRAVGRSFGVSGRSDSAEGAGVNGFSDPGVGVSGTSRFNDGVVGAANIDGRSGVFGFNTREVGASFGVSGTAASPDGAGVNGFSDPGNGVRGTSRTNDGVVGAANGERKSGVFGFNTRTIGASFGVSGTTESRDGAGVNGFSGAGYGGRFSGGRAALRLEPLNRVGPDAGSHQRGELFVDANGDLFYCKASGSPGAWFRVALTPA